MAQHGMQPCRSPCYVCHACCPTCHALGEWACQAMSLPPTWWSSVYLFGKECLWERSTGIGVPSSRHIAAFRVALNALLRHRRPCVSCRIGTQKATVVVVAQAAPPGSRPGVRLFLPPATPPSLAHHARPSWHFVASAFARHTHNAPPLPSRPSLFPAPPSL